MYEQFFEHRKPLSWLILKPQKSPCFEPGCLETGAMEQKDGILQKLSRLLCVKHVEFFWEKINIKKLL